MENNASTQQSHCGWVILEQGSQHDKHSTGQNKCHTNQPSRQQKTHEILVSAALPLAHQFCFTWQQNEPTDTEAHTQRRDRKKRVEQWFKTKVRHSGLF